MANFQQQMDMLKYADNMLDRHHMADADVPSLLEVTGISQHGMATSSGLKDYDYQSLANLCMGQAELMQLVTINKIPIPPEVMEHFKHIKCHCMMGLFAEIGRAWLTIDSDIYIWTYENTRDVAYFDGLNHVIVSVGIVTPKPKVFVADVKYLLILTTPVEIVVLGVTFGDSTKISTSPIHSININYDEMQLINKPIFLLNTDNVAITTIEGTDDGRIFLGARDGCLYEICYQAESNWFGKRCNKINHSQGMLSYIVPGFLKAFSEVDPIIKITIDNSRKLLYVLTEKGSIEAWNLGSEDKIQRIARLSQNDICQMAGNILKSIDDTIFKPVTAICPLQKSDSQFLNLIAITQGGVRFYFSTAQLQVTSNQMSFDLYKPNNLYLMHVRMPPGYTPNATVGKPKNIHSAFHSHGSVLMISTATQQDKDLLWSLSSEPFPLRPYLAESTTILSLDGQVWALAQAKRRRSGNLNETFLQNAQTPTQVVLLTNQGVHIVALLKPVDILQQILSACHGPHHDAVKAYFQIQNESQACATSVLMACMESLSGKNLSLWATQAFFLYGGEPHVEANSSMIRSGIENQSPIFMSTPYSVRPASSVQQSLLYQTRNQDNTMMNMSGGNFQTDVRNMTYSAKHNGLYLHLSRLIRPIWKMKCIDDKFQSTITRDDCNLILNDLHALKRFLENNPIINTPSGLAQGQINQNIPGLRQDSSVYHQETIMGNSMGLQRRNLQEEVFAEEKFSIDSLIRYIKYACEVMGLWKILCEHQFHLLIMALPKEDQLKLADSTFRDLILLRGKTCALLIVALINSYLSDNASLSSISAKLREVCPTLYRHEDAISHKATEILLLSKHSRDPDEKEEKLRTALQLCKNVAPNLPLSSICQQFIDSEFYKGVIELCAVCASKLDPNDAAIHFNRQNDQVEDQEGYIAYTSRVNCYKEIIQMLEKIYINATCVNAGNNSVDTTLNEFLGVEEDTISQHILPIVGIALQTSDQLLHYSVYDWLLSHQLLGRLLGISEPSLGAYLKQAVDKNPDNLILTDLLWKYHERNLQHTAAAKVLDNLASMQSNLIKLDQRFEYLARAVMCMRNDTVGSSSQNGVLLKDLEDKLETARVQKLILDTLSNYRATPAITDAINSLNYKLYDKSQLYCDFSEPFELWECALTILNCFRCNDQQEIENVWKCILDKEYNHPGSGNEKSYRMLSKVQNLAREHGTSGQCFPISFLIKELELRCCKLKLDHYPVPVAFVDMNIDIGILLDIYSRLVSLNDRMWSTNGDEYYLIKSIDSFTSYLTKQSNLLLKNRRKVGAKVQELISASLNILYTRNCTTGLINSLRETQTKIDRIIK